jgi:ketosteroid isomerase-like protein
MSPDSSQIVREALEAFANQGVDGMTTFWHPDIDWRAIEGAPDDVGEMRGVPALRGYYEEWIDMFDDLTLRLEEVRDVGDDRAVARQRVTGRAKLSGAETELTYAVVYTIRDAKIVRGREYMTLEQALAAAGSP